MCVKSVAHDYTQITHTKDGKNYSLKEIHLLLFLLLKKGAKNYDESIKEIHLLVFLLLKNPCD